MSSALSTQNQEYNPHAKNENEQKEIKNQLEEYQKILEITRTTVQQLELQKKQIIEKNLT